MRYAGSGESGAGKKKRTETDGVSQRKGEVEASCERREKTRVTTLRGKKVGRKLLRQRGETDRGRGRQRREAASQGEEA